MKRTLYLFAGLWILSWTAGCQCVGLTERYADLIDDFADNSLKFDRLYRAEFDLNRIGKPDWCRSRFNRMLCRSACQLTGGDCHCDACSANAQADAAETPSSDDAPLLPPGENSNRENQVPPAPRRVNKEAKTWQIP